VIDWIDCADSSRVLAVAYDEVGERILVRFRDGTQWQYQGCPPAVWEEFNSPQTSKGRFITERLDQHQHGPLTE
jgi:hypothetical protein